MVNSNGKFQNKRPVIVGDTADVHLQRALTILRNENINPTVSIELAPKNNGVFCGREEVLTLLKEILPDSGAEVWSLDEGESVGANEVAFTIKAPYGAVGLYETAIRGMLASYTGWATAAKECVDAANPIKVVGYGASYIHPSVAAELDYACMIAGCTSISTTLGARLASIHPLGTMPPSLLLILGDTAKTTQLFNKHMTQDIPRYALVDVLRDESEDALSVAQLLKEELRGIRINTPDSRGGLKVDLVKEIRKRLDLANYKHVDIMVGDNLTPTDIAEFVKAEAPVSLFAVGAYVASAPSNPYSFDIKEIDGSPISRRGNIPGMNAVPRLNRMI
jgi:nicotinate phosphoribosyltransferase